MHLVDYYTMYGKMVSIGHGTSFVTWNIVFILRWYFICCFLSCVIWCVIIISSGSKSSKRCTVVNLFKMLVRCATTPRNMEAIFYEIHQIIIIHVRELTYVKCYEFLILIYVYIVQYTHRDAHTDTHTVDSFRMNVFNLISKWICSCFMLIFTNYVCRSLARRRAAVELNVRNMCKNCHDKSDTPYRSRSHSRIFTFENRRTLNVINEQTYLYIVREIYVFAENEHIMSSMPE